MYAERAKIISQLQQEILLLEGLKLSKSGSVDMGLGPILNAFPNSTFPLAAVHQFLFNGTKGKAATIGFITGLLSPLMGNGGVSAWISAARTIFPPGLKNFGIQPDRFIFIDLQKEKDLPWAIEEALKCSALTAVIGEMKEIGFTASRRLQLAVEQSQVTGFMLCNDSQKLNATACVSRWRITPLPSDAVDDHLPGVGFPKWKVELLRIRNGRTGVWEVDWRGGRFISFRENISINGFSRDASAAKSLPMRDASAAKTG
jgi:protein ImuA